MATNIAEILLIEDDLGDSDLTREILQKGGEGSHLRVIEDGAEAMRYFFDQVKLNRARRPDLVILDLNLPKIDGRALLRELKSDEVLRDIPIVVFTTSNAQADILLSYSLGANGYVSKPHEYHEFESAVSAIRDFWLRFASLPSGTMSKFQNENRPAQTAASNLNLLVISEDPQEFRSVSDLCQKASRLGLAVSCYDKPEQAAKKLEEERFDFVMLDANIADHLNKAMIEQIRSLAGPTPVITFYHSFPSASRDGISPWQLLLNAFAKHKDDMQLRRSHERLDEMVRLRTADLLDANKRLQEAVVARSAAENAARRSEARYHKLANSTFEGIVVHDGEIIIDCNLSFANFFQYQIPELIGKNILELIVDKERMFFAAKIKSEDESPFESLGVRRDKDQVQLEFQSKWLDDGERKYRITACRDFKEKQALEQLRRRHSALIKANKDLEQFASIASHDLKEPIRSMETFLRLLKEEAHDQLSPVAQKYVDIALKSSVRMKALTSDLLDFSRLAGAEFSLVPVDLQDAFEEAREHLGEAIRESGALIEQDKLPLVQGDKLQLVQLFQNLLSNAMKFRKPGEPPHIQVRSRKANGMWQVSVHDNGIGFDKKHAQNIFVMFQRLHSQDKYPGSGLGLAICFKIIQNHQGRIWADSQPGVGSTFYFTLQAAVSRNLSGRKILFVDDSEDVRLLFGHLLAARGAHVVAADSGEAALAKVKEETDFDMIIMDIEMPKMNGKDAAAALRKLGFDRKIVAFTGHTKNWTESDYRPLGFDGYVCKDKAFTTLADYCIHILSDSVAGPRDAELKDAAILLEHNS